MGNSESENVRTNILIKRKHYEWIKEQNEKTSRQFNLSKFVRDNLDRAMKEHRKRKENDEKDGDRR